MNLVLLGAPGSGKGTQAQIISSKYSIQRISLGDILREEVKKDSSLGRTVEGYMKKGILVPDNIIQEVMESNLNNPGFILDGFPRNLNQAKMLERILLNKSFKIDKVIYLNVSESKIIQRLTGRRICRNCGALYHIVTMRPKKEGICDKCGGELIIRPDDNEDTVRKRWRVFMDKTHALIEYYGNKDLILDIDGDGDKDTVFDKIKAGL